MVEKKGFFSKKKSESDKKKSFFSRFSKKNESQNESEQEFSDGVEPDQQEPVEQSGVAMDSSDNLTIEKPVEIENETVYEGGDFNQPKRKFLNRLKDGLTKTRQSLKGKLSGVFSAGRKIDDDLYEELEEMLITSDLGVQTSIELIEKVRKSVDRDQLKDGVELKKEIKNLILEIIEKTPVVPLSMDQHPMIALVVGVNGVGKTTTIGKLATHWKREGKKVLICAADTFRAAAVEQLEIWAKRADVEIVMKTESNDPAAVVFDAIQRAKQSSADILLIDTAGRLHNNANLMKELEKIYKVVEREFPGAPHHVFLILDAITGQNGLQQAKQFVSKVSVSDLVITKLDGTAKGGVAVAISNELNLPIRFIGVGERQDDLLPFNSEQFVDSLFDDAVSSVSTKIS